MADVIPAETKLVWTGGSVEVFASFSAFLLFYIKSHFNMLSVVSIRCIIEIGHLNEVVCQYFSQVTSIAHFYILHVFGNIHTLYLSVEKNLVVWRNFRLNRKIAHLNGEKCAKFVHFGGKCINYMFLCAEKFSPKFCLWRNKWQIWGMDNISSIWCSTSNQIILLKLQWLCSKHLGLCKNRNLMEMPGW